MLQTGRAVVLDKVKLIENDQSHEYEVFIANGFNAVGETMRCEGYVAFADCAYCAVVVVGSLAGEDVVGFTFVEVFVIA